MAIYIRVYIRGGRSGFKNHSSKRASNVSAFIERLVLRTNCASGLAKDDHLRTLSSFSRSFWRGLKLRTLLGSPPKYSMFF